VVRTENARLGIAKGLRSWASIMYVWHVFESIQHRTFKSKDMQMQMQMPVNIQMQMQTQMQLDL
jgi:hypothetical protein